MKVMTISASVRFSKDTGQDAWKVIELEAEASVGPEEDWVLCQQGLYAALSAQLKSLWGKNGQNPEHGLEGSVSRVKRPPRSETRHWCQQHQTEFKQYEKDGRAWRSHKAPDGTWCKEG
jgi:hypothetical protein